MSKANDSSNGTEAILTRAGTPAPQCGTGDLARQMAEKGLEIGQTPGTASAFAKASSEALGEGGGRPSH